MGATVRLIRNVSFAALCLIGASALAGMKTNTSTSVNVNADGSGFASGSLSSARVDPSNLVFIQCEVNSSGSASCKARNSAGTMKSCISIDQNFYNIAKTLNDSSFVSFWWDSSGTCTSILVRYGSNYMP